MANILGNEKREQVLVLGRLGWSLRRIEEATGVRRETASRYLAAAGIAVRSTGRWGHPPPKAKPASSWKAGFETSTYGRFSDVRRGQDGTKFANPQRGGIQ